MDTSSAYDLDKLRATKREATEKAAAQKAAEQEAQLRAVRAWDRAMKRAFKGIFPRRDRLAALNAPDWSDR